MRPVKAGANTAIGYAHKKIYQAEDENIGIKAAHRTELVGEAGLRTAYHRHKTAPYRRVSKLQQKSVRANAGLSYRQALYDNPELKKNVLARMWQKQKLKRQYAKAAREAKKAGTRAKDAAVTTEKIVVSIGRTIRRHPVACAIIILLLLVFFLIASVLSSFSNIGTGGLGSLAASTYLAEDQDINQAELSYTEWETDLQMEMGYMEDAQNPDMDKYRIPLGTARQMLLDGEAPVYRLLPSGPEKLAPIAAVTTGLWYENYREFAIAPEDLGALDKLVRRETDRLMGNRPQLHKNEERRPAPER